MAQKAQEQLSTEELEATIRRVVKEELKEIWDYIFWMEEQLPDPDAGKDIRPELAQYLKEQAQSVERKLLPAEKVHRPHE